MHSWVEKKRDLHLSSNSWVLGDETDLTDHLQRVQNVDGAISDGGTGGESIHGTGRPFNAQDRDGRVRHLSMLTHLKRQVNLHFIFEQDFSLNMPSYSGVEARGTSPPLQVSHTHIGHTVCAEDDLSGREIGGHSHTKCKSRAQGSRPSRLQMLHFSLYVTGRKKNIFTYAKMLGVTF